VFGWSIFMVLFLANGPMSAHTSRQRAKALGDGPDSARFDATVAGVGDEKV
jgi:hypothetical protein